MILNWTRKKSSAQDGVASTPAFHEGVARVPSFNDQPEAVIVQTRQPLPTQQPRTQMSVVKSIVAPAPVVTPAAGLGLSKSDPMDDIALFRKAVPYHLDMLGVTWLAKKSLCTTSAMTDQVGAFRQKDGTAVVVVSPRASIDYLPGFIDALKLEGVTTQKTLYLTSSLLAQLYQEATERKRNATASDSDELNESSAMRMFVEVMRDAAAKNASDFDIVCKDECSEFFLSVDGHRYISATHPKRLGESLTQNVFASRQIKGESRSHTSYLPKQRQSALLSIDLEDGTKQFLRMQTLPGLTGPTCNFRLLPRKGKKNQFNSLNELGYSEDQEKKLMGALTARNGLVLFLGSTGSGKSTTMDMCFTLHPLIHSIKVIEVADPPEIENPLVIKHAVRSDGDSGSDADAKQWTLALGACLRSNPDIVAIGELRYAEVAQMAQHATLTGHLSVASFHSSSPFMAIERLLEMGLSPSILFSEEGFRVLVSQELHPKLCPDCSIKPKPGDPMYAIVGELRHKYSLSLDDVDHLKVLGPGCTTCKDSSRPGFIKGRTACLSVLQSTPQLREILLSSSPETRMKRARAYFYSTRTVGFNDPDMTGKTVVQHMLYKVLQGQIPFDYFLQKTGDIAIHEVAALSEVL